jgi:hypothetical protein
MLKDYMTACSTGPKFAAAFQKHFKAMCPPVFRHNVSLLAADPQFDGRMSDA